MIYILHSELTADDLELLYSSADGFEDICFSPILIDSEELRRRIDPKDDWPMETYFRLLIPDLIPDTVERLLYLDTDIIVNGSLMDLYDCDLEGALFAVCEDLNATGDWMPYAKVLFKDMFAVGYRYFNAGVMLWNLKAIRDRGWCFERYVSVATQIRDLMELRDQDILNYAHWQDIKYLSNYRFNLFARFYSRLGETLESIGPNGHNTAIIHYLGQKPWDAAQIHFDIESLWWDYAAKTPLFHDIAYSFIRDLVFSRGEIEEQIRLSNKNKELKENLNEVIDMNKKLIEMINAMK